MASLDSTDDVVDLTPASPHIRGAVVWFGLGLTALLGLFVAIPPLHA